MKQCAQCHQAFEITKSDMEFYEKMSPVFDDEKFPIPPPRFCPACRHQLRLAFRNERALYHRKCDLTGKPILSIYSPESPFRVYERDAWWSDQWDALFYGKDFDFSKTLSEQLKALYRKVPHVALYNTNIENSTYTNYALNQKNCYLIFGAGDNEDCMYGKFVVYCKDVVDCLSVYSCEGCYEGVASEKCYHCRFFTNCRNCSDCTMIEDCSGCRNCVGCFGIRNKQYCVFNKQHSKEEYKKRESELGDLTWEKTMLIQKKLDELKKTIPHVQSHIYASENCTGDGVYNSKNCLNAFDCKDCEDCKNIYFSPKTLLTHDCAFCAPDGNRYCYNLCSTVGLELSMTCFFVWYGSNIYYSMNCHHCSDIFACIGLRDKKYCILNKQYTKEEYTPMVKRIVKHMIKTKEWGDYFPFNLSPFAYNETIAQEYFPLTKEQVIAMGLSWKEDGKEREAPANQPIFIPPENIREVNDDICNQTLGCENTGRKYKIIPQELEFYRKMKLPIPKIHPDQRHYNRLQLHSAYKLWNGKCGKCGTEIKTIHAHENKNKIYCEKCFSQEVY
ncbi:hypothetical protein COY07_02545 [Candidatus Peregrinibacteria bacterium CG_4_10_14_0_2_um_filter_43_11]|nr:MAG: hypothetical protein COY07_02545 [Candidatus Peregrinibacteria bacterium CG_4_10_14_0_2_um_filter_43_11]